VAPVDSKEMFVFFQVSFKRDAFFAQTQFKCMGVLFLSERENIVTVVARMNEVVGPAHGILDEDRYVPVASP
jgi:hypothetical protein